MHPLKVTSVPFNASILDQLKILENKEKKSRSIYKITGSNMSSRIKRNNV